MRSPRRNRGRVDHGGTEEWRIAEGDVPNRQNGCTLTDDFVEQALVTGEHRDLLGPYFGKTFRGAIVRGETIGKPPAGRLQEGAGQRVAGLGRPTPLRQPELSCEATNRVAGAVGGTDVAGLPSGFAVRGGVPDILISALPLDPRPDLTGFVRNVMNVTLARVDRYGDRAERNALPGEGCAVPRTLSE